MTPARLQAHDVQAIALARELLRDGSSFRPSYALSLGLATSNTLALMLASERYERMCTEVNDALDAVEAAQSRATYSLDGEPPSTLREFLDANRDAPLPIPVLACIVGLAPGECISLSYGGGGVATLRRVT